MPDKGTEAIPGVKDDDLKATLANLPALPNTSADDPERFLTEVRGIAEQRQQLEWQKEPAAEIAVFVLTEYPREAVGHLSAEDVIDLAASAGPILGKIFFMNRDASNGFSVSLPDENPAKVLQWLQSSGLGSAPIVFVYRKTKQLVARLQGSKGGTQRFPIRDVPPALTLDELLKALEYFHLANVLTPKPCPVGVWQKGRAGQYVPGEYPEKAIQRDLANALFYWFRGLVRAETEDSIKIGRIDVRLLRLSSATGPSPLCYWAIIELKVARSVHNAPGKKKPKKIAFSETIDEIIEGIRQAWAFQQNRLADLGLLEVFDVRKDKSTKLLSQKQILDALATYQPPPICNERALFGSAADARKAGYTAI